MRRAIASFLAVCSVIGVAVADAKAPTKSKSSGLTDVPRVFSARKVGGQGGISVECVLVANSHPRQADCTLVQVWITKTSDADVAAVQTEANRVRKLPPAELAKYCQALQEPSTWTRDAKAQESRDAATAACQSHAPEALAKVIAADAARLSRTCHVTVNPPWTGTFMQSDANSWIQSGDSTCLTSSMILWRDAGGGMLWNLKETRTKKPSGQGAACDWAKDEVSEWRWNYEAEAAAGCEWLKYNE